MKAKTIVPIAVVVVLVAVVLMGNWYIGKRVERAISMTIYRNLTQSEVPILVSYEDISVNPLARKVAFENVDVGRGSAEQVMTLQSVEIVTSWRDFLGMVRTENLETLNGVDLKLKSLDLPVPEVEEAVTVESLEFSFDGPLSEALLREERSNPIPINGRAQLTVEGIALPSGMNEGPWGMTDAVGLSSQIDRLYLDIDFQPDKLRVRLRSLEIENPCLDLSTSGQLTLSEDDPDAELRSVAAKLELHYAPEGKKLPLGFLEIRDEVSLGELTIKGSLNYAPGRGSEEFSLPTGKLDLRIKDFAISISSETRREMRIPDFDTFAISDIEISGSIDKKTARIKRATLRSDQMKIDGELEIDFSGVDPEQARLRKAQVQVRDIDRGLIPLVRAMEDNLGKQILNGDRIDLRWEGTLGNGQVVWN